MRLEHSARLNTPEIGGTRWSAACYFKFTSPRFTATIFLSRSIERVIAMKRAFLIFVLLLLFTTGYASASCSNRDIEYGDSCEGDYEPENNLIVYLFEGEEDDLVTITLTWDDNAEGTILLIGPVVSVTQTEYDLQEQATDDDGEAVMEEMELPDDGTYAIGVAFDDDASYEILLESGDSEDDEDDEDDAGDFAFLDDTVLIISSAEIPRNDADGYYYSLVSVTADDVDLLVDTGNETYSTGCGDLSEDGASLLYTTNAENTLTTSFTHFEVFSARSDGSRERRLTETDANEIAPRWSPDGERVVFMASETPDDINSYEIYVMDADGDNLQQITDNNDADRFPSWSPDGELILFHSTRDGDSELYTMTDVGSDLEQLTDNDWNDARGMFSPDGERIVFNGNRFGYDDLYVMDADGDNIEQLTESEDHYEFGAIWSPDGEMIAFTANPDLTSEPNQVWVMNADGSDAQAVFDDSNLDIGLCDWGVIED
jgi:Tol biopolymer transport system component